jgi:hypothetical protein
MMKVNFNSRQFEKDMNKIIAYSEGFIEGIQKGKTKFFANLGKMIIESAKIFIDSNARMNPAILHHVYEWQKTGSPSARLFDINYTVNNMGLSFNSTFSQSTSIKNGSSEPFYDKARIMENGIPVTISPVNSSVLVFEDNNDVIFTKGDIVVENPGGTEVQGSFEKVYSEFFTKYFTQAFLRTSGLSHYFNNPVVYKTKLSQAKRGGKNLGIQVGYSWIGSAGMPNG